MTVPFFSQYTLCNYVSKLHYMYFHELYPTHMWYKNLASILGLPSQGCSQNQNGLEKSMEQRAQGRPAIRSSVCLTILGPRSQSRGQETRSQSRGQETRSQSRGQESHRFCPCPCPCFWDLFRSHRWFRARNLCANPSRSKHKIFRPRNAMTPMTGLNSSPVMSSSPKVERGWSFQANWKCKDRKDRKEPLAPWSASCAQISPRRWPWNFLPSSRSWRDCSIPTLTKCLHSTKCRCRHLRWSCSASPWNDRRPSMILTTKAYW